MSAVERSRGAVWKYYLYKATSSQGFIMPVTVEYMLSQGLSFSQVGTVEALFMAGWVLWEIPTGYLGDRWGRRASLLVANGLIAVTLFGLSVASTFPEFVLMYSVWALSITFRSGSSDAWLYDILEERLEESEFSRVKGRGRSLTLAVTAAGSVGGAYLATSNWSLPFVVNGGLALASTLVVASFPKNAQYREDADDGDRFTIIDALPVLRTKLSKPPLRAFILYTVLFFALREVAATFVQPVSTSVGIDVGQLGLLYAGLSLFASGVSYFTGAIKEAVGVRWWFYTAPLTVGATFVLASVVPTLAVGAFFLMRGVNTVSGALKSQFINDHLDAVGRATALSAVSMVSALFAAVARLAGGTYAEYTDPITMLATFGGVFLVASVALLVFSNPVADADRPAGATAD